MIYGYARVSTDAQDLTSQLAQLKAAGCEKVFREKITGTTADRPQHQKSASKKGNSISTLVLNRIS
jgi:DNA invertase Pin-like site-specific DNA recombinase